MFHVVEDAEKEDDVEAAQLRLRHLVQIENPIIGLGCQLAMDGQEIRNLDAVDRGYLCASPLRLEAEPSVPGPDVEYAFAAEVLRYRKSSEASPLVFQLHGAVDQRAVRQLEAVVPALLRELAAEIEFPALFDCVHANAAPRL